MKGVDTNILVRFLVGDDEQQAKKVYELFKKVEADKKELFVPATVVLELIWVLESAYGVSRDDLIETIGELLLMPILKFEHQSALQQFGQLAQSATGDLSDLLIGCCARECGFAPLLTFDKKASKSDLFELLK